MQQFKHRLPLSPPRCNIVQMVGMQDPPGRARQISPIRLAEEVTSKRTIYPEHTDHPLVRSELRSRTAKRLSPPKLTKPNLLESIAVAPAQPIVPSVSLRVYRGISPVSRNCPTHLNPLATPSIQSKYPVDRSSTPASGKRLGLFSRKYQEGSTSPFPQAKTVLAVGNSHAQMYASLQRNLLTSAQMERLRRTVRNRDI